MKDSVRFSWIVVVLTVLLRLVAFQVFFTISTGVSWSC